MLGRNYWGIDIGGSAVKGVKLRHTKQGFRIAAADVVPLQGEASSEPSFGRDRRIWIALDELARRNDIGSERLAIGVPARATFVRPFRILVVGGKSIDAIVRYEVQELIPFGLDAVVWDHELFGTPDEQNRQSGVMFALKKEVLNNYIMSLGAARLQTDDVTTTPLALYDFARHDCDLAEPTLLLDIGATCTDMVMVHNDRYTTANLPSGGDMITRAVQERFGLNEERAERAKKNVGQLRRAREVLEAMLPALRRYAGELAVAVRRLQAEVGNVPPSKVIVFGGAAKNIGLPKMLSQTFECEVELHEGFQNFEFTEDADREEIQSKAADLAVAAGLALRAAGSATSQISLITAGAARQKLASQTKPFVAATLGVLAAVLAWVGFFGAWEVNNVLAPQNEELEAKVTSVESHIARWQALQKPSSAESELATYAKLGPYRFVWLRVLDRLVAIMPPANARPGNDQQKAVLLDLEVSLNGGIVQGSSWWAIRSRNNPTADLNFADEAVLNRLAEQAGFSEVKMHTADKGQFYANALSSDASPDRSGRYLIFPVTFQADANALLNRTTP